MEEPGGPRPTVEELQSLTVVKLRQRLAQYGIPQSGNIAMFSNHLVFQISISFIFQKLKKFDNLRLYFR